MEAYPGHLEGHRGGLEAYLGHLEACLGNLEAYLGHLKGSLGHLTGSLGMKEKEHRCAAKSGARKGMKDVGMVRSLEVISVHVLGSSSYLDHGSRA